MKKQQEQSGLIAEDSQNEESFVLDTYGWSDAEALNSHSYVLPRVSKVLSDARPRVSTVLDIGCGNGFTAQQLFLEGFEVTGVDASPDGIEQARMSYPDVRFETYSVYDDPAGVLDSTFDAVVSTEVIEHLFFPSLLIQRAWVMLKPGGLLIISTPFHGYIKNLALSLVNGWDNHFDVSWDGGHIKFFSEKTLERLVAKSGFEEIRFSNVGRIPYLRKSMICVAKRPSDS